MKQATTRRKEAPPTLQVSKRIREGAFILLCSLAIYLFIALATYHQADSAWSHSGMNEEAHNAAGKAGAWFSDILFSLFGYIAYIFPLALSLAGIFLYRDLPAKNEPNPFIWFIRGIGLLIALIASCGLIAMHWNQATATLPMTTGGLLGVAIKSATVGYLNQLGATVILFALLLTGTTLFTGVSWLTLLSLGSNRSVPFFGFLKSLFVSVLESGITQARQIRFPSLEDLPKNPFNKQRSEEIPLQKKAISNLFSAEHATPLFADQQEPLPIFKEAPLFEKSLDAPKSRKLIKSKEGENRKPSPNKAALSVIYPATNHAMPSLALLEVAEKATKLGYSSSQLQELSRLVEMRLLEFGVEVKVVGVQPGPVITRFELDLAAGIKVSKITGLAKDLARSLSVVSVRVVEVIPGKSVVGLEIPNVHRELVRLKAVLEDEAYQQADSPLSMALGKDISGRPVVVDLARMPHLLVAGTTGSGKSVGLNAMLLSILYKASPQEVRMILIDPKMLELAVYDNIPHLLTPVVTDMKDAANALRWCVAEMERRYQLMAALGVRNLSGYNHKVTQASKAGSPLLDPFWLPESNQPAEPLENLPFVVVVVDEFADMMMVVGKKVEELIARIAQKARAAGIHLILATQRPSVDVITGLIKANIPTRIAFQVSSRIDSRTILDQSGAEQLLGHGDMLYLPPGMGVPHRIHGAFVSDEEVHKVAEQLRKSGKPAYIENVVQSSVVSSSPFGEEEDVDELYDQAVAIVTEARKASISLVQRRLKIGYNRAARLVEQMEAEGVVSPIQSNGMREVLVGPPPAN